MKPTNRTVTDVTTGRKARMYRCQFSQKTEFRYEDTGERIDTSYCNLNILPSKVKTDNGKTYKVEPEQFLPATVKVTHIKRAWNKRFVKI